MKEVWPSSQGLQLRIPEPTSLYSWAQLFSKEEGDDGSSYFCVNVEDTMEPTLNVYMLQNGDDAWHKHLTLESDLLLHLRSSPEGVLVDNKIYVATDNEMATDRRQSAGPIFGRSPRGRSI